MDQSFEVLKEIPLFDGLTPENLQQIHSLCNLQQFSAGVTICEAGSASTEMFILLEGNLAVCTSGGFEVARISPVGVVGEMGLFTGEPRSADVLTTDGVIVFQICRDKVRELFVKHREICVGVLRNVIRILSQKLKYTSSIRKCNTWDSFYSILSVWETIINTLRLTRGTIFVRFEHQVSL